MTKALLVLLLAPVAHAKILSGSAICASERSSDYNVQFTWDDGGRLTSAELFKSSGEHLFTFKIARDATTFSVAPSQATLDLEAPSGETVRMRATIDDHGLGAGKLDWQIPTENFTENDAPLMCSF